MRRKWMTVLAACLGLFLLTACGSKEYEAAEDYIQLKPGAQAEEDTLGTDVAQEEEETDASGVPKRGIAIDEAEDDDTESDAADTSAETENSDILSELTGKQTGGVTAEEWSQFMEEYREEVFSSGGSEEWSKAMEGYREMLAGGTNRWEDEDSPQITFITADLNTDGVPELLMKYRYHHFSTKDTVISLFTWWNGHEKDLADDIYLTPIWSCYPGTGVFAQAEEDPNESYYYMADVTEMQSDLQMSQLVGRVFSEQDETVYEWIKLTQRSLNDEKVEYVDAERFQTLLEELTGGVEAVELPGVDEWYANTEENREAYLK